MKKCSKCKIEKPLKDFCNRSQNKDGKHPYCRECNNTINKDYYTQNKKEHIQRNKSWKEKNKLKSKNYHKEYNKEYYYKNKQQIFHYKRNHERKKYHNDLDFKLKKQLRSMVFRLLTLTKQEKTNKSLKLLNYTVEQFKQRIEFNFDENMSWGNHGEIWEIDHTKPIDRFIKQGETRPYVIHSLSNLKPMNVSNNREKSNKFII